MIQFILRQKILLKQARTSAACMGRRKRRVTKMTNKKTMTLQEAIAPIAPIMNINSMIGAPESISFDKAIKSLTKDQIKQKIDSLNKSIEECCSDYAYWGFSGQLSYWRAINDIFEAAEIIGNNNLPYVKFKDEAGIVMAKMAKIETYGRKILELAKQETNNADN